MDDTDHQEAKPLTRPLLTRSEALALALLLGMPIAADAFDASPSPESEQQVVADARPDAPELLVG